MDERKNETFSGYKSLNNAFKVGAKNDWGCTKEEAFCTAMLLFLDQNPDLQNFACSAFRAASSRQIHSGNSIIDEFKHAMAKLKMDARKSKPIRFKLPEEQPKEDPSMG